MAVQNYDESALVAVLVQSANYTAVPNQIVPCDVSGGGFTVTLPTAPPDRTGMEIKIIKQAVSPNTLTVACGGSDVFNVAGGSASGTLTLLNQAMRLQYSSVAHIWYVISTDVPLSQLDTRYLNQPTTGNAATATKLATARNIDGQAFDGTANVTVVAPGTHAATSKTTPVDADELPLVDSAASNVLKKLTWANLKAGIVAAFGATPTASTLVEWDANANLSANTFLRGTTSTATAAGTTTLTITSTQVQVFTGSTTQTVKLATTSVPAGHQCTIVNQSSGVVTVQSSGANNVATLAAGAVGTFTSQKATPTAAADWVVAGLASTTVEYTSTQSGVSVPAGVTGVWIESLMSPGSGGGSGRKGAAGSVRCGGGGGGAGAMITNFFVPAARLGSTFTVTLPAGGAGGAAVSANDTNGNAGTGGGAASFTSGSFVAQTYLSNGGAGGTNATGTGGGGGLAQWSGGNAGAASTTGLTGATAANTTTGVACGGGGGGGITSADAASNGGGGGGSTLSYSSLTNPAGGIVGGASPSAGNAAIAGIGGLGAGGGAASVSGDAQSGATPTGYGAGGGGGGAALNSTGNSGAGGTGGPSYCRLRWVYV